MADLSWRCSVTPPVSLTQALAALRSGQTSLSNRVTALETTVNSLELAVYGKVVYTEEQLDAALAVKGLIYIAADLELTHTIVIPDGTFLLPLSLDGNPIVLTYPHVAGTSRSVVRLEGRRAGIRGFKITTGRPLTTALSTLDWGVEVSASASIDVSDFYIGYCEIYNVNAGIVRNGVPASLFAERGTIEHVYIHTFCGEPAAPAGRGGVTINYNTRHLRLRNIHIAGRINAETHDVMGNGFWCGNFSDFTIYENCYVTEVDRHGFEHWNSQSAPVNTNGNKDPRFINCEVGYIGRNIGWTGFLGSFGFTILCSGTCKLIGCKVERALGIAYELACDSVNDGHYLMEGCSYDLVETDIAPQGVSMNSTGSVLGIVAVIKGCIFGRSESTVLQEHCGICIEQGCHSVQISGNTFNDSGNRHIYTNGTALTPPYNGLVITDNVFNWSASPPPNTYPVNVSLVWLQATAVLRNNHAFVEAGSGNGVYRITQTGEVLTGGTGFAAIVGSGVDTNAAGDSNHTIERD